MNATQKSVRFNENIVVIEYKSNERIYNKSIMNKILKIIMRLLKNS
jgi:hypothetical protein